MNWLDEFKVLYCLLIVVSAVFYFWGIFGEDDSLNPTIKLIGIYLAVMPIFYIGLLNFVSVGVAIIFTIVVTLLIIEAFGDRIT